MQIFNFSVEIEHIIIKYKSRQEFSTLKLVISNFNIEKLIGSKILLKAKNCESLSWPWPYEKVVITSAGLDLMKKLWKPQLDLTLRHTDHKTYLLIQICTLYKEIMKNQKDEAVRVYLYCLLFTVSTVSC